MEENSLDFNFWPSFSDLMLTLVLILVIVVFAVIVSFSVKPEPEKPPDPPKGDIIPSEVKENQMAVINAIAAQYNVPPKATEKDSNSFLIRIPHENGGYSEIHIKNEATLQRYSFSDRILFKPDRYVLNEEGEKTLLIVGRQIKRNLHNFSEIQIQGHADPDTPGIERSNLHLAALRAIEVFRFLQHKIGMDPARHLMSATSFGEYKPVQRSDKDRTYTPEKLKKHNRTRELKSKNRRIEILLIYPSEQTSLTEG